MKKITHPKLKSNPITVENIMEVTEREFRLICWLLFSSLEKRVNLLIVLILLVLGAVLGVEMINV